MIPVKNQTFSSAVVALFCLLGVVTGWLARGFLSPAAAFKSDTSAIPTLESVSPAHGSGSSQTFTVTVSMLGGYRKILRVGLLFNDAVEAAHSCYPQYEMTSGKLGLMADSGVSLQIAPLNEKKLENSQCLVDAAASTVRGEGNKLAISIPVTFKPAFAGAKSTMAIATTIAGKSSELEMHGSWTVPAL